MICITANITKLVDGNILSLNVLAFRKLVIQEHCNHQEVVITKPRLYGHSFYKLVYLIFVHNVELKLIVDTVNYYLEVSEVVCPYVGSYFPRFRGVESRASSVLRVAGYLPIGLIVAIFNGTPAYFTCMLGSFLRAMSQGCVSKRHSHTEI